MAIFNSYVCLPEGEPPILEHAATRSTKSYPEESAMYIILIGFSS